MVGTRSDQARSIVERMFSLADAMRRAQGNALDFLGFGPKECGYRVLASGLHWRLRDYGGSDIGPSLLIVAAPIKRPYIWDLNASASAVRYCLIHGMRVYLLEWIAPSPRGGDAGFEIYGDRAIFECVTRIADTRHGVAPFLAGHSLGGTLAAIFAALHSQRIRGLVLLGAPLCFEAASSQFRDALVSLVPCSPSESGIVPGTMLSQLSAMASPGTFVWSRIIETTRSVSDPRAMAINAMIERWALDEVALPARLARQIVEWLYRDNRLCRGAFPVRDRTVGPSDVRVPTLAVVNTADEIAGLASVRPFLDAIPVRDVNLIEYPGESGVSLQHLALLVGPRAYTEVWPKIMSWVGDHE